LRSVPHPGGAANCTSYSKDPQMRTAKAALVAALAAAAIAAVPGAASAKTNSHRAHAAGGAVAPSVLPSAVRVRIKRGETALDRAGDYIDRDMSAKALASLKNARANMYAAWRSAQYIVVNAPPPPPPAGKVAAHAAGAAVGSPGTQYATPEDTAMAVLSYQHDVVGASYGMLDGSKGTLRDEVSKTIFAALDRRDKAIVWIHNRPAPPPAPAGKLSAHAAGAPVATGGFDGLMQGLIVDLDDELLQGKELTAGGALTAGEKRIVLFAGAQIQNTKDTVNTWWPPVPAAG
jgi:hypothetical protein